VEKRHRVGYNRTKEEEIMKITMFSFLCLSVFFLVPSGVFASGPTQEVSIIAKRFEFYPNQIVVRVNQPVRIYLTSIDTTHGFALGDFKINKEFGSGEIATVDFTPNKKGTFDFHCSVFCGLGHMGMKGKFYVVD